MLSMGEENQSICPRLHEPFPTFLEQAVCFGGNVQSPSQVLKQQLINVACLLSSQPHEEKYFAILSTSHQICMQGYILFCLYHLFKFLQ